MFFPKIPYKPAKTKKSVFGMAGLNLSENYKEGQLRDSFGISSGEYPCLSSKPQAEAIDNYSGADDVYFHDGHELVCKNGRLLVDGGEMADVLPGTKQFALVNDYVVIWPDKLTVKLPSKEPDAEEEDKEIKVEPIEVEVEIDTSECDCDFRADDDGGTFMKLSGRKIGSYKSELLTFSNDFGSVNSYSQGLTVNYGSDRDILEDSFKDGEWQWNELNGYLVVRSDIDIRKGEVFIPSYDPEDAETPFNVVAFTTDYEMENAGFPGEYNTEGYYAVSTGKEGEWREEEGIIMNPETGEPEEIIYHVFEYRHTFDVYKAGGEGTLKDFEKGDALLIEGSPFKLFDCKAGLIKEIDEGGREVHFISEVQPPPSYYCVLSDPLEAYWVDPEDHTHNNGANVGIYLPAYISETGEAVEVEVGYSVRFDRRIPRGAVICAAVPEGGIKALEPRELRKTWTTDMVPTVFAWLEEEEEVIYPLAVLNDGGGIWPAPAGGGAYQMQKFSEMEFSMTVKRALPKLDYICEKDNRLWGVCNETKTVWASALGQPRQFYDFSGMSTDSYSVAVSSRGEFTGIASFGGAVLCFKEDMLYKMLGDLPSEFYLSEYSAPGVQKGSFASFCVINNTLFYKGKGGIYAYRGALPRLVSYELGTGAFRRVVAGKEGNVLYVSGETGEDNEVIGNSEEVRGEVSAEPTELIWDTSSASQSSAPSPQGEGETGDGGAKTQSAEVPAPDNPSAPSGHLPLHKGGIQGSQDGEGDGETDTSSVGKGGTFPTTPQSATLTAPLSQGSRDGEGNGGITYSYDTLHGLWLKEADMKVQALRDRDGELLALYGGEVYRGGSVYGPWSAEFVPFYENTFQKQSYSKLNLRFEMEPGAYICGFLSYDGGSYEQVFTKSADESRTVSVPLRIRRCDTVKLKLEGSGKVKIRELAREYMPQSER